jgi:hypothetical protein
MNARAQPDVGVDLSLPAIGDEMPKRSPNTASYLLRMHPNLKSRFAEAAAVEGLSLNTWMLRVLAEHSKLSEKGWRSIPVTDPPREHVVTTAGIVSKPGFSQLPGLIATQITPGTSVNPPRSSVFIAGPGTITIAPTSSSGAQTHSSGGDVIWVTPDEDVPEL